MENIFNIYVNKWDQHLDIKGGGHVGLKVVLNMSSVDYYFISSFSHYSFLID